MFPSSPENGADTVVDLQGGERGNFCVVPLRRGSTFMGLSQNRRNTRGQVQLQGEGRTSYQYSYTGEIIFLDITFCNFKTVFRIKTEYHISCEMHLYYQSFKQIYVVF